MQKPEVVEAESFDARMNSLILSTNLDELTIWAWAGLAQATIEAMANGEI